MRFFKVKGNQRKVGISSGNKYGSKQINPEPFGIAAGF